eukprot:CAMPEP_0174381660 /NCGR_PEP_ID=MMETSP0811_2-20130205/124164_1 /TAXON_ID=73025 ORGANISM="Eutreptiella gymnastica-like, Strain CCMP1594" /NCGR_SAMPLE_ID=MMETSP0811_2 /ASSEMBLY_ACC=CAM_ASM_000667 /LENGTH=83 /DNA_ID=CAMNT_0015534885 /DNA_START=842 /DNA_END=1094 /DNA_ORIENTATION=-
MRNSVPEAPLPSQAFARCRVLQAIVRGTSSTPRRCATARMRARQAILGGPVRRAVGQSGFPDAAIEPMTAAVSRGDDVVEVGE